MGILPCLWPMILAFPLIWNHHCNKCSSWRSSSSCTFASTLSKDIDGRYCQSTDFCHISYIRFCQSSRSLVSRILRTICCWRIVSFMDIGSTGSCNLALFRWSFMRPQCCCWRNLYQRLCSFGIIWMKLRRRNLICRFRIVWTGSWNTEVVNNWDITCHLRMVIAQGIL